MALFDRLFNKTKPPEPLALDPLKDLVLAKLRVGYLVDYDLRTWQVTDHQLYRFNDGRRAEEWELIEGRDKLYLELSTGDGEVYSLSRSIPLGAIGDGKVRQHILDHEDPPDRVDHDGTTFYLDGSVGGHMSAFAAGGPNRQLIAWEYLDESEERFLSIVQWGESEFTAVRGELVEDYQFSNILPPADG